jgi:hypothetical protein
MLTGLNFSPTHFTHCAEMNFNQPPLRQIENGRLIERLKLQFVMEILIENI